MVGGGARRQRRDDLTHTQRVLIGEGQAENNCLMLLGISLATAWMEGGGSGIRHCEAEGDR